MFRLLLACVLCFTAYAAHANVQELLLDIFAVAGEVLKPQPNAEQDYLDAALKHAEQLADEPSPRLLEALDILSQMYQGTLTSASDTTRRKSVRIQTLRLAVMRSLGVHGEKIEETCWALAFMHGSLNNRQGALDHMQCYANSIRQRLGDDNSQTVRARLLVAKELGANGHTVEASAEFQKLLQKTDGIELDTVVSSWIAYSLVLEQLGQYDQQEKAIHRAIQLAEPQREQEPENYAFNLATLARFYYRWGRTEEADALTWQCYSIANAHNPQGFVTAIQAWNASSVSISARRWTEARELISKAMRLHRQYMGESYMHLGSMELELSDIELGEGNTAAAIEAVQRALTHFKKYGYEVSEQGASAHMRLAGFNLRAGKLDAAMESARAALKVLAELPDSGAIQIIGALHMRAQIELAAGRNGEALATMKEAADRMKSRLSAVDGLQIDAGALREQFRAFISDYVDILVNTNEAAASFEIFQYARQDSTGATVAKTSARAAASNDDLAAELRRYDEVLRRWRQVDQQTLSTGLAGRSTAEAQQLVAQRASLETELVERRHKMFEQYPKYFEFTASSPVPMDAVQSQLGSEDGLLAFYFDAKGSYGWIVRRDGFHVYRLRISLDELRAAVKRVRESVSIAADGSMRPFDSKAAAFLYARLINPFRDQLRGLHHLTFIADDALRSLPAALLAPQPGESSSARVEWLIRHFPISELPSVSAFRAVRRLPVGTSWERPFAGIGAPSLRGSAYAGVAPNFGSKLRGAGVRLEDIRSMQPLPDAATELTSMSAYLHGRTADVLLGPGANESAVKALPLEKYRVIVFATHALVAGEKRGLVEPALVLTPPDEATEGNDGLLTASEIASLNLTADWVILSACNTAAPDGTPAAENLSGLARAFFAAGARALLVSHWYVSSSATTKLTTAMLRHYSEQPSMGKAAALRQAILSMMDGGSIEAHPALWAPFVLVGDGTR